MKDFNSEFKNRTKQLSLEVIALYGRLRKSDEIRIIGKQLIRSATSTAANYRAVIRARSDKEKFAKLCIVVEEADETLFWLEILDESGLAMSHNLKPLMEEATEILKVMSSYKYKIKKSNN